MPTHALDADAVGDAAPERLAAEARRVTATVAHVARADAAVRCELRRGEERVDVEAELGAHEAPPVVGTP
jgi:hypothetical protein